MSSEHFLLLCDPFLPTTQDTLSKYCKVSTDIKDLPKATIAVIRSATKCTKDWIDGCPKLKYIIRGGVGLDNVDSEYARSKNIIVTNTAAASTNAVVELTFGLMLAVVSRIGKAHLTMCEKKWEKKALKRSELKGKTLGLFGTGNIGASVAIIAKAFGMTVIGFDLPTVRVPGIDYCNTKDEFFSKSDIISLHVPALKSTIEMINKDAINKMKKGVILINTARGQLINYTDIVPALKSGQIGGYGTDVFPEEPPRKDFPIYGLDNVVLTPHIGSSSVENLGRITDACVNIVKDINENTEDKPKKRPFNANYASGPCSKRPAWSIDVVKSDLWGRSHRSEEAKKIITNLLSLFREILSIPTDYKVGIIAGSDTGAVECAMWNLLGLLPVDVLSFDAFSNGWYKNCLELGIETNKISADYGYLPDVSKINQDHDSIITWNGTTSGVKIPDGKWIKDPKDRKGLIICDATSAIFAMDVPINKLDVVTFSWQKSLGGEATQGMLILSPKAVHRLETFKPKRPIPKIFRIVKDGKLDEAIFKGNVINTPSMATIIDCVDALTWAKKIGGQKAMQARSEENLKVMTEFVNNCPFIEFLAKEERYRSSTALTLVFKDPVYDKLDKTVKKEKIKMLCKLLHEEGVAHDIMGYREAPLGIRFWGGSTINSSDLKLVTPWIEWAWKKVKKTF